MLKWLMRLMFAGLLCVALGAAGLLGIYFYIKPQLPDVSSLKDVQLATPMRVYSRDGELMAQYGEVRRIPLKLSEIPQPMIDAVLSTEDARFYEHPGIDPIGILRAAVAVAASGHASQGASTITQQVARNFFLTNEKTIIRKVKEVFLAWRIEQNLSKDEILELYLNKIPLGYRAYGVGAAAQVYFGKTVDQLSLDEIAIIAGLPKAPSLLNPIRSPERSFDRRNVVLGRMLDTGKITQSQYDEFSKKPVVARFHGAEMTLYAPYLGEMVRQKMVDQFGEDAYTMGLNITTTVTAKNQKAARDGLLKGLLDYDMRHGYRGPEKQLWQHGEAPWGTEQLLDYLAKQPSYNPLIPAVVTALDDRSAEVLLKDGRQGELDWNAIKWARAFISDSRMGPALRSAREALKVGAQIWVREEGERLVLGQIPDANAALVALNPHNGAVEGLVGGFSFELSKFNRVEQARRQIGSNIKPFLYATGLEHGYTLASLINDAPINQWDASSGKAWQPKNSPAIYEGPLPLRQGLAKSKNVMSVRLLRAIGISTFVDSLSRFGFPRDQIAPYEPLALGAAEFTPMEVVRGYAAFANGGHLVTPYFIDKVTDNNGTVLFEAKPSVTCPSCDAALLALGGNPQQVSGADATQPLDSVAAGPCTPPADGASCAPTAVSPESAFLIADTLKSAIWGGNGWHGTAGRAGTDLKRHDIAGKTGTTNEARDLWFSGFTHNLVATAWIGFDNHQRSLGAGAFGGNTALPIWSEFMKVALKDVPEQEMAKPADIISVQVDQETGLLSRGGGYSEFFKQGTEPTRYGEPAATPSDPFSGGGENISTDDLF